MLAYLYKKYLEYFSFSYKKTKTITHLSDTRSSDLKLLDKEATYYGDDYRGAAIFVGLLGASIIFTAVTPFATKLNHTAEVCCELSEIFLMLLLIVVVIVYGNSESLPKPIRCINIIDKKKRWIETRKKAEELRYFALKNQIENATRDSTFISQLKDTLLEIIGDEKNGQIKYNLTKHKEYEAIEDVTNLITISGFFIALIFAVLHLFINSSFFIYFTVFLPALVGSFHATNNFLQINKLSLQHKDMYEKLENIKNDIDNFGDILQLSIQLYKNLTAADQIWGQSIGQQARLKP